jgi:prepilin-type N-terminal cleavage/methylation domain-containing protein
MKNKGFTMVELLIVISVFGIVVAMVATISPSVARRSKMNRAANELIADINLAKQLASAESRYVAVDFSDTGTFYTIRKQVNVISFNADDDDLDDESFWAIVKEGRPLDGDVFFKPEDITDFAFSSTGKTRLFDADKPDPTLITINVFIKKKSGAGGMDFVKEIKIYPYGGIRIE